MGCEGDQKMTLDLIKEKILEVDKNANSLQVYFLLQVGGNMEVRLADIADGETESELRDLFAAYIKRTIVENEELELCELSVADERNNAIYHYDYVDYPEELGRFKSFCIEEAIGYEKFNFDTDNLQNLSGYIIYIGSMENGLLLYKKHYPISLIKRDSFLLGAIKSKKRFECLSGNDIIRLNGECQMLRVDDQIIILNVDVLERNLGFKQLINKAAKKAIEEIEKIHLLEDIEILNKEIQNFSYARRLSKVVSSSPIFQLSIPKEMIIKFTKETPALKGKFKYSDDGETICLDTKKSKEDFIKLLNDAFLRSELTHQYYEAKAKDNINR